MARALACALVLMVAGCGGSPGDADDAGTEHDAGVLLDATVAPDGGRPSCEGLPSGDDAARVSADAVRSELVEEGFAPLDTGLPIDVPVSAQDRDGLADGDPAPLLVRSEAELLARAPDDGARLFYEGTPPAIDWSTQALLFSYRDNPFTDVALFRRDDEIVLVSTHLAACVPPEDPPYPPHERLQRVAQVIPRVATVSARTREVRYALRHFPLEPGIERVPESPLLVRNAGNASVVLVGSTWHVWTEGYSGATGMMFHGTSSDGRAWDFAWDTAHSTTFEGLGTFAPRRHPSVLVEGAELTMFFDLSDGDPATPDLHRAVSSDGTLWREVRRASLPCDLHHAYVVREDDVLHAWGHDRRFRSILHARSSDGGLAWTCDAGPVLERGDADALDGQGIFHPAVVRIDDRWVMFYAASYGFRATYRVHLAYATSEDGTTFVRGAPILAQTLEPGHWESGQGNLGRPLPILRGDDLWLYYTAAEGGEPSLGLALGPGWSPP